MKSFYLPCRTAIYALLVFFFTLYNQSSFAAPPDYSITISGNVLTITDNSNNGDVLDITEDGAGMIKFNVTNASRTYDFNSGATSNLPYTHLLTGITSIVVNTKGGSDAINVSAFANTIMPNLTLNGGTGDDAMNFNGDITFVLNASLDVDLQNDDATPGTDNVTLAANTNLIFSGTGSATIKVSKNVLVNAGGSIETVNGNLTVEANQQAIGTTGGFEGVALDGCRLITRGTGSLTVKGKGGTLNSSKIGVYLYNGGKIDGGSGPVNVTGNGVGAATSNNHGVFVEGADARISSTGGNVSVIGIAGGFGAGAANNRGVVLTGSAQISAGGSGTVTISGTGGTSAQGNNNDGVLIAGNGSKIFSNSGDVSVTGVGGGTGASSRSNYGIALNSSGQITSGGSGTLTVNGTGGAGSAATSNNYGVSVSDVNSKIAAGGNLILTGTGGTAGTHNYGVNVADRGQITSNGSGTVGVTGNGGSGQNSYGVFVSYSGALITSGGGDVTVQGTGGSSGSSQFGVYAFEGGSISAGGMGNVSVTGTAGATSGFTKYGVYLNGNGASITSGGGNVTVTGIEGGSGAGTGFGFVNGDTGTITTATNGGNIKVIANSMLINGPISTNAAGQTTLHQNTNNVLIALGDLTDTKGGPLKLSDTELDWVTTGTLVIGNANSGDFFVVLAITRAANTAMQLITAGDITLNQGINTAGGNLLLDCGAFPKAIKPTFNGADATVGTLSFGSNLALVINGTTPGDGSGSTYTQLSVVGSVDLTGVDLLMVGTYVPVVGQSFTIVDNDLSEAITGTFNGLPEGASIANFLGSIYPASITYVGGPNNNDVVLTVLPADYSITTTGGNLVITDLAGNSDQLDVTENGTGIQFATTPARTYSLDGAAPATFPVTIANVANFNNITINTATGDDVNNIGAFTAALKNLTINGGTGDDAVNFNGDIAFALDANLDVDLQNDDPTPGTDNVTVATNANLLLSGTGTATVKVSRNVTVNNGGSIETADGDLTVEANQQMTGTSGSFRGVNLFGGTLQVNGSGALSVKGRGGDFGDFLFGVLISDAGKIQGGSGAATVEGLGGSGIFLDVGVLVSGANSRITSSGGAVQVKGTGGGRAESSDNYGVGVEGGGTITAAGSGTVTVEGLGGTSVFGADLGVVVSIDSRITSSGGNVSVTGTGGGSGASGVNWGVFVAGQITAGGNGTVTVVGNGGTASTGSTNYGVYVAGTDSKIISSGGNVSVTGTGGGSGTSGDNYGIYVYLAGQITAGMNGTVTVVGNGGTAPTGNSNIGVIVNGSNSTITSSGGNVSVTGTGGGSGAGTSNHGIYVQFAGQITAGGSGTVTVVGNGGTSSTGISNHGVYVYDTDSKITSSGGNVSVTGTGGGSGTSGDNYGVYVLSAGQITAGGGGTVTVFGNGGTAPTGSTNLGVHIYGANSKITTSGGNLSVTGTGGGSGASSDNYGILILSGQIVAGGNGTVTVVGNGGTASTGIANHGVYMTNVDAMISSNGGNVHVTGTGGGMDASAQNVGVYLDNSQIKAGGNGTVTVEGYGGTPSTGGSNLGILLLVNWQITSSGGNVSVTGVEGSGPNSTGYVSLFGGQITTVPNGGNIALIANSMSMENEVSTPTGNSVTLRPYTNGVQVDLGSTTNPIGGPLGLSDAELDQITTGTLNIGDANTGDITVSADITRPASTIINMTSGGAANFNTSALNSAGGNVNISATGGVNPSATGIDINAGSGTLDFATGNDLNIPINGTAVDAQYRQLNVVGEVDVTGVDLVFSGSYIVDDCETYTIINNDGTDAIVGTFNGLAEGAIFTNFRGSGFNATITYVGGDGNDVVIDVPDVTPPIITCPANIVRTADANQCSAAVTYTVSATDNCSSVTLTRTNGQPSGSAFPVGFSVVNWLATDIKGNSSACSFSITVTDNQLPSIVCPSNVTKVADPGQCTAITTYPNPNFSDNCPGAYLTRTDGLASGSQFPTGMTNIAWKATDAGGNTAICNFTVTVSDTQMPSIICPANLVKNTDAGLCTAVVSYPTPTATDNCSSGVSAVRTSGLASGSAFMKGATQIIWQATDGVGLTKTCAFTVTVNDAQAPTITCPGNQVRSTDAGLCTAVMNYTTPTFTDNCAGASVAIQSGLISGSAFPKGQTTVVWKATDAVGLTKTCSFRVTVNDTQAPTFTLCPSSQSVSTDAGLCTAAVTYATPTATDNCTPAPSVLKQSGLASGSAFPKGTSAVVWKATDGAGLTKTCSFTITVTDAQLPTITCPANIAVTAAPGTCNAVVTYASPTASDNCGVFSNILLSGLASGANYSQGVTTNVWRATDNSGTSNTCAFTVTVSCGAGPSFTQSASAGKSEQLAVRSEQLEMPTTGYQQPITMNLAPNPATTQVLVTVEGLGENGGDLSVFDAQGRVVWQQHNVLSPMSNINVADLSSGLYFVTLRSAGTVVTKRLVVSR